MKFINIKSNIFAISQIQFIGKSEHQVMKELKNADMVYRIVVYTIGNVSPVFINFKHESERDNFFEEAFRKLQEY